MSQVPGHLQNLTQSEIQPFRGDAEQIWGACHPSYTGCRLWQSLLSDDDGPQFIAVFLDYDETLENLIYWGVLDA